MKHNFGTWIVVIAVLNVGVQLYRHDQSWDITFSLMVVGLALIAYSLLKER